jgi:all-trans-retinol dehydrogenase (NAD+)
MDKLISHTKSYYSKLVSRFVATFLKSGKKGYLRLAVASLLAWSVSYAFLKNFGFLSKKSVVGKHVFITGAGSGIGKLMAIRFARLGAKVSVTDIKLSWAEDTVKQIRTEKNQAVAVECDVTSVEAVDRAADIAEKEFGPVDILINNAGVVSGKKLLDNSEKGIRITIDVNTTAHAWTVRRFLPQMIKRDEGHVVTIASIAGHFGVSGLADYCASKFGAVGFNESMRMELRSLKSNVKTTCICPYYIDTGMFHGVKSPFIPILSEKYAANRIVNAVLQEESITIMPWFLWTFVWLKAFLPTSVCDLAADITGSNKSMNDFQGKRKVE